MDGQGVLNIVTWIIMLMIFAYISRELEMWRMISEIEAYLTMFKMTRDRALTVTVNTFKTMLTRKKVEYERLRTIDERVRDLIDTVVILPVDLDPFGIVRKIKHVMDTTQATIEEEIRRLLPGTPRPDIKNLADLVGATHALNQIYKSMDHLYRIARKFKSLWLLMQVYALLPFVTEEIKALENAVEAFNRGLPIGDSVGPIVASTLISKYGGLQTVEYPAEDTMVSRIVVKEREVYVIKAAGPGGTTGRLDEALEWLIKNHGAGLSMIITVDAARKLESEESGAISQGFGVAIGGIGVEQFNIENIASKYGIPLYAVLIKMSESEALSVITKQLYQSAVKALPILERIIEERSKPGDKLVVIGVGNSIGVAP